LLTPIVAAALLGTVMGGSVPRPALAADAACNVGASHDMLERSSAVFEPRIAGFEREEKAHPPRPGGVVVIGSSSIERWTTLESDFASVSARNRGLSGSIVSDLIDLAPRLVTNAPEIVLVYAGDNDIDAGLSPDQVLNRLRALIDRVHTLAPNAKIALMTVKPSPSRDCERTLQEEVNRGIQKIVANGPEYLQGRLRASIFCADRLHMNADGYKGWEAVVEPALEALEKP
jgi:lysophospholipase L1-like esterase